MLQANDPLDLLADKAMFGDGSGNGLACQAITSAVSTSVDLLLYDFVSVRAYEQASVAIYTDRSLDVGISDRIAVFGCDAAIQLIREAVHG